MKRSLLTATVILMASSGLAFAQSATTGTASDSMAGFSSWDQTTRDAFFSDDNMLRSSDEVRSAWDSLDSTEQAQIKADCQLMQADAGSSTTGGQSTSAAGSSTSAPAGTSSETTASTTTGGGAAAGSGMSAPAAGSSAGASGSADMPSQASLKELCEAVESY